MVMFDEFVDFSDFVVWFSMLLMRVALLHVSVLFFVLVAACFQTKKEGVL
jgi:hypothetical protein